jgi:hypothetical protein
MLDRHHYSSSVKSVAKSSHAYTETISFGKWDQNMDSAKLSKECMSMDLAI